MNEQEPESNRHRTGNGGKQEASSSSEQDSSVSHRAPPTPIRLSEGEPFKRLVTNEERPLSSAPAGVENVSEPSMNMTNVEQLGWSEAELKDFPPARELKVTLQNIMNSTLGPAIDLSLVLTSKEIYSWFYESYVQLTSLRLFRRRFGGFVEIVPEDQLRGDEVENIVLNFTAEPAKTWLNECLVKEFFGSDPDDIISFIVRSINLDCYLSVQVDEYHIPSKRSHGRREFVHPTLVYGYDNETRTLLALGFDTKGIFTKLTFSYDDFRRAYASAKRISQNSPFNRPLVTLIKVKTPQRHRYPFGVGRFLWELEDYLSSTIDSAKRYKLTSFLPSNADMEGMTRFGFSVYEHFDIGLQQLSCGNSWMDYNSMHVLFEHKRFLLEAFRFIIHEYQIEGKLVALTNDFESVAQEFHSMRWKFIRYNFTKDSKLIRQIIDQIGPAREIERELLQRIHDQIQSDCQHLLLEDSHYVAHQPVSGDLRGRK